jgi:transposase
MPTSQKTLEPIATIGVDLGKNTFHLVGLEKRGAIVLQQKVSRGQLERRLANIPRCLIGMEACSGSHHIGRQLAALGHDVRLIPAQYVKPFLKGHKNDYRDAERSRPSINTATAPSREPHSNPTRDLLSSLLDRRAAACVLLSWGPDSSRALTPWRPPSQGAV